MNTIDTDYGNGKVIRRFTGTYASNFENFFIHIAINSSNRSVIEVFLENKTTRQSAYFLLEFKTYRINEIQIDNTEETHHLSGTTCLSMFYNEPKKYTELGVFVPLGTPVKTTLSLRIEIENEESDRREIKTIDLDVRLLIAAENNVESVSAAFSPQDVLSEAIPSDIGFTCAHSCFPLGDISK